MRYRPRAYNLKLRMGIVRAQPVCNDGKALLELCNEHSQVVLLRSLIFSPPERSGTSALVASNVELQPMQAHVVEITDNLRAFSVDRREIVISLLLEPRPPEQPSATRYHFELKAGRCVEFRRDAV
jgi:hypothetical protein